jgi:hypothetical protein
MDCDGHGTHVAVRFLQFYGLFSFNFGQGVIAAVPGNEYNISGFELAYGATLAAYKVFDCAGHTTDDSM